MAPPVCHFMERRKGAFGLLDSVPFCLLFFLYLLFFVSKWVLLVDDKFKEFWRFDCQTEICMFVEILYALTCIVNLFHFGNMEAIQVFARLCSLCFSRCLFYSLHLFLYRLFSFLETIGTFVPKIPISALMFIMRISRECSLAGTSLTFFIIWPCFVVITRNCPWLLGKNKQIACLNLQYRILAVMENSDSSVPFVYAVALSLVCL